jgi:putative intracellular protease/amidase
MKGKIGVLIEDHFDGTEYNRFNEYFPSVGYEVEYLSHLWGNKELVFGSNPEAHHVEFKVTVSTEINEVQPSDYKGIICIGGYAADRLRYQVNVKKGQKNNSPALVFLRKAIATENLVLGTICHSLWLFCADPDLLKGRKVTCAHNIVCDVENAGAEIVYNQHEVDIIVDGQIMGVSSDNSVTADLAIDGNLVTGKHPGVTDLFMEAFVQEIEKK